PAELADDARALVRAQPAMASICRLADAALRAAAEPEAVAAAVARFDAAMGAAAAAAEARAAAPGPGRGAALPPSAGSLVERALGRAHGDGGAFRVLCLEARPRREGAALAARLAGAGIATELWVDAAAARCVGTASVVFVGADTIAPSGLIHKIGTLGL